MVLGAADLSVDVIEQTLSVVVKYDRDADKVLESIGRGHGHDHHGHHHHHHQHDHSH